MDNDASWTAEFRRILKQDDVLSETKTAMARHIELTRELGRLHRDDPPLLVQARDVVEAGLDFDEAVGYLAINAYRPNGQLYGHAACRAAIVEVVLGQDGGVPWV